MGILEVTLVKGDLGFLKYLVSNHSADVNGKLICRCTCNVIVTTLCTCVCIEAYTLAGGLPVSYQFGRLVTKTVVPDM